MKILIIIVSVIVFCASGVFAQSQKVNADPSKVKFVTSDIDNFWRAFDLAAKETDKAKKAAIFQAEYFDKGSVGLKDFVRLRIKNAQAMVEAVENLPKFYASIRPSTLRVKELEKKMRKSFVKFKKIYPEAVFPDVYFVIAITNTGGSASESGLLIGTELYGLSKDLARDEFLPFFQKAFLSNEKDEQKVKKTVERLLGVMMKPIDKLPSIVAHESCHFNQKYSALNTLLAKSIQEGACDFIAEKIAGETINPAQKIYGDQNEAQLWKEFQAEMKDAGTKNWMYNGFSSADRPPDLGYYMGYKISSAYYKQAQNKRQAIKDILETKDFAAFLDKSGYGAKSKR